VDEMGPPARDLDDNEGRQVGHQARQGAAKRAELFVIVCVIGAMFVGVNVFRYHCATSDWAACIMFGRKTSR